MNKAKGKMGQSRPDTASERVVAGFRLLLFFRLLFFFFLIVLPEMSTIQWHIEVLG